MSKHERHETCVYIGPAALCPIPDQDQPYILITGDQEDWVQPLIQERLKRMPEVNCLQSGKTRSGNLEQPKPGIRLITQASTEFLKKKMLDGAIRAGI